MITLLYLDIIYSNSNVSDIGFTPYKLAKSNDKLHIAGQFTINPSLIEEYD